MSGKQPIRALTSIRGIAAWWVVLYHFREAWPAGYPDIATRVMAQGYLAVDLFFMLSGFVIALNYAGSFRDGVRGSLRFYALRLARIYPLHLAMMIAFLANPLAIHLFSSQGQTGEGYGADYYVLSLLLVQNWGFTRVLDWNIPAWSISTEWFAYLCFPLLALVLRWLPGRTATRLALVALLLGLLVWNGRASGGLGGRIEELGILRCLIEFSIGMVLYSLVSAWPARPAALSWAGLAVAVGCTAAYALSGVPDYVVMPLGFIGLILALLDDRLWPVRLLHGRVLEWLGTVSYSTYLTHYFIKTWVKFLLVPAGPVTIMPMLVYLAATLVASAVMYHAVEIPGQRRVRAWVTRRVPGPTAPRAVDEPAAP